MATKGTLQKVRGRYGLSLRVLGRIIGRNASSVMEKLNGDSPWKLTEAHAITAHIRRNHDPAATVEQLFGLPALPQLGENFVENVTEQTRPANTDASRRRKARAA